jgi:hypothetical protein
MADTVLGLSDYAKELGQWNKPYVYREFPKMLYRGTDGPGRVEVEQRVVSTETEEAEARAAGWCVSPTLAKDLALELQAAVGTAAAERAAQDRRMSAPAQAEAAVADTAAGAKHLGAIPEQPRRPRPSRAKKKEAQHEKT